jgi:hypothetical protein
VNRHFLNGVIKLQQKNAQNVSPVEKEAVTCLIKVVKDGERNTAAAAAFESEESDEEEGNLVDDVEGKRKFVSHNDKQGYYNLNFIIGSSAEVERLWSMAGLILTEKLYCTSPMLFETSCFLKFNREWWDMATIARAVRAMERSGSSNKRFDMA